MSITESGTYCFMNLACIKLHLQAAAPGAFKARKVQVYAIEVRQVNTAILLHGFAGKLFNLRVVLTLRVNVTTIMGVLDVM
jgi:hypothetical protein